MGVQGSGLEQIFSVIPMDIPQDKTMMTQGPVSQQIVASKRTLLAKWTHEPDKDSILQLLENNSDLQKWDKIF